MYRDKPGNALMINLGSVWHRVPSARWTHHLNSVPLLELHQHRLPDHAVLVVVNVVLVIQGGHLHPVPPEGGEGLLHVMSAEVDGEHVAAWSEVRL